MFIYHGIYYISKGDYGIRCVFAAFVVCGVGGQIGVIFSFLSDCDVSNKHSEKNMLTIIISFYLLGYVFL